MEKFYQLAVSVQRKNLGGVAVEGSYLPLNDGGIVTEQGASDSEQNDQLFQQR